MKKIKKINKEKINKLIKVIVIIAVISIPIMYSFFYLKSYWNPYNNLQDLQVALVNLDNGVNGDNKGSDLVQALKDTNTIKICDVSSENASSGLVSGDYYAVITIPSDFTATLSQAASSDRHTATITYSPNQKTNYLASQIISKIVLSVELKLQSQVAQNVTSGLVDNMNSVPDSLQSISDGSGQLLEGANTLSDALGKINDGVDTLNDNYTKFDNGLDSAYQGSVVIKESTGKINSGVSQLEAGSKSLDDAITKIDQAADELEKVKKSTIESEKISKLLEELNDIKEIDISKIDINNIDPEKVQEIVNTVESFKNNNTEEINSLIDTAKSIKKLTEGISSVKDITSQLKNGSDRLYSNMVVLSNGTTQLAEGSKTMSDGLDTLQKNSKIIRSSLDNLSSATQSTYDGSKDLSNGISTLKGSVDSGIDSTKDKLEQLNGLDNYVSNPVEIQENDYGEVNAYGISFTPLFLSIGLWVGALMAYVVLYYDQENRFSIIGKYAKNEPLKITLYFVIAIAQGLITALLLKLGLKFDVTNALLYYGSSILISIAFMSIIQCLITNLGDIGKFLALIILVLQLSASGGTFPVETISPIFQKFTSFLPMTYSIKLVKEALIVQDDGLALQNVIVLIAFTIIPLAITVIRSKIKSYKNSKNKSEILEKEKVETEDKEKIEK